MFDIATVKIERMVEPREDVWHDVVLPDGELAGFRWKLRSVFSPEIRPLHDKLINLNEKDVQETITVGVELIAAATVEIEDLENNGEIVTPENCKPIVSEHFLWLGTQLVDVLGEETKGLVE